MIKMGQVGKFMDARDKPNIAALKQLAKLVKFIYRSTKHTYGWLSFYWDDTIKDLCPKDKPTIGQAITASWLEKFQALSKRMEQ